MNILADHIAAMRQRFIAEHGKEPKILALGRWDVRELCKAFAAMNDVTPRQLLQAARDGATVYGAQIKVDGRLGRVPGALWWQADRRH